MASYSAKRPRIFLHYHELIPGAPLQITGIPGKTTVNSETKERENEPSTSKPSVQLRAYAATVHDEYIRFGDIIRALGGSTPGFSLVVLALPALVPTGLPIAAPAGAVMMLIGALMVIGQADTTVPGWLARRKFTKAQLQNLVQVAAPVLAWLERLLTPRMSWMLKRRQLRMVGTIIALDGLVIFLPIPFGNMIPAFAVMVIALGMMLGDGLAIIVGILVSLIAILIAVAVMVLGFEIIMVIFT
jgi:hypothetical protein